MSKQIELYREEIIDLLTILKMDAEMAISGDWDTCTEEGKEGFHAQINLINELLKKIN